MQNYTFFILLLLSWPGLLWAQEAEVKNIASGTYFTCISFDEEGSIWAGTNKQGLWKADSLSGEGMPVFRLFYGGNFNNYKLQTIATPTVNGRTSVWVGTNGISSGTAVGGGVYHFLTTSPGEPKYYIAERNRKVATGMLLPYKDNDGIPSRDSKAIAVDKNGTVWSAHGYHHLTVSGSYYYEIDPFTYQYKAYYSPGGYFVTPGGLGMKPHDAGIFKNVTMNTMPYPAYTINTPIEKSAQTRVCQSIACNDKEVWMGYAAYEDEKGGYNYTGILRYDLAGNKLGTITFESEPALPFTSSFASPRALSIHFQENGDPWLAFNFKKGFAVKKNNTEWIHVDQLYKYDSTTYTHNPSTLFANGIEFSFSPQLIASSGKKVFLGTTSGLLIYKGKGDFRQDSSYTLLTTEHGLSSNYIKSVITGGGYVYVVTDKGVDQVLIPGDLEVFHIVEKEDPFYNGDGKNYETMLKLESENLNKDVLAIETALPIFSADGTTSSVFRYYTNDFDGFYEGKYDWGVALILGKEDTAKFGKFYLKPIDKYENTKKEYVDLIYRHPHFIDKSLSDEGRDAYYFFTIYNKNEQRNIFKHKVQFSLPPVLFVHGVWSEISSLSDLENGFRSERNYANYKTLRIYKTIENDFEYPYEHDIKFIPENIDKLKNICRRNNMSAGKVSVVVHSRGGLYTRAYIEDFVVGRPYKNDIHCLITLNTPHAGSQQANLVLDKRILRVRVPSKFPTPIKPFTVKEIEVGKLFEAGVGKGDREFKNGGMVLRVNKGFIPDLNLNKNLQKVKDYKVPVHAVATQFNLCELPLGYCKISDMVPTDTSLTKKVLKSTPAYILAQLAVGGLFEFGDDLVGQIFNGEPSDFIVPQSSMEAGLSDKYVSRFPGHQIAHIAAVQAVGGDGVCNAPIVRAHVLDLLAQNMFDGSSNFTLEGYDPPREEKGNQLEYKFWSHLGTQPEGSHARIAADEETYLMIDRDVLNQSFNIGDTMKMNIATSTIDTMMIVYETPDDDDYVLMAIHKVTSDTTLVKFKIPANYAGIFKVTAYGFNSNGFVAMDELELFASIPDSIHVNDIYFNSISKTIELNGFTKYTYQLKGVFSDNTDKTITDQPGVKFYLTDSTILQGADMYTLQPKKIGETYLVGIYKDKIDSLRFVVYEAPKLDTTLTGDFFVTVNDEGIAHFDWSTIQEFACEKFVIEVSTDKVNFEEYHSVPASGNSLKQSNYSYSGKFMKIETPVFFRIRVVDSVGNTNIFFRQIEVSPLEIITAVFDFEEEFPETNFRMYPNPSNGNEVSVIVNVVKAEKEALLEVFNLNGRKVRSELVAIVSGENRIPLNLPANVASGIYVVKLTLAEEQHTAKISINK